MENFQNNAQNSENIPPSNTIATASPTSPNKETEVEAKVTTSIPKLRNMPAKLVVVSQVCHQLLPQQPTAREFRYGRPLVTDNYPFIIPRIILTEEWRQVDSSWVDKDKCSMLIIANNEGKNLTKIPTREELENTSKRIVEIGVMTSYLAPSVDELAASAIEEKGLNVWEKMAKKEIPKPIPITTITPVFFIPPGEEHPYSCYDLSLLYFRCKEGKANCIFTFYPN